ncbi:MAG: hypothetical protein H0W94_04150 [Actinobacteria bacterium]|nr:hypothetical protein [Actinomycetota bacterium]
MQAPRAAAAVLVIVDRVSFEEMLAVPEFERLAAAGGAALSATEPEPPEGKLERYTAIGASSTSDTGAPDATAAALASNGVTVCAAGSASSETRPLRPDLLLAGSRAGATVGSVCGGVAAERTDPAFPGGVRTDPDPILALASNIGSALHSTGGDVFLIVNLGDTLRLDLESGAATPPEIRLFRRSALREAGSLVAEVLDRLGETRTMVIVATPAPSAEMDEVGDEVTPLLLASGPGQGLLAASGSPRSLTSETTRLEGLVSPVDVAPTILRFFDVPIPSEMIGQSLTATDSEAPFDLHRRHLEHRRIRLPVQIGALVVIAVLALTTMAALAVVQVRRRPLPPRVAAVVRFMGPCGIALVLALLAGGTLPRLTYPWVVSFLVLSTLVLAWLSLRTGDRFRDPLSPFRFLGFVGLGFVVLDATLGGRALRLPLLGGTAFDGVRYYGLPNAFIALLLASALFVAFRPSPFVGFAIVFGAALFAGFPSLGANLGAAFTLSLAAGLWWVLRTRPRFGIREVAFMGGVTLAGLALVLLANRYLTTVPTHVGRFVAETESSGLNAVIDTARHRLAVGFRQLNEVPAAYIPLFGLPVVFFLALRPKGEIARGLSVDGAWRHIVLVLTSASIAAYFVEDTGVAAAAPGFLYALAALAYPVLLPPATVGHGPEVHDDTRSGEP